MVNKVSNNNLGDALKDGVAVIDFSAGWCGPCKMIAPIVDELAKELEGKVSFYNVDVDENPDLAAEYGVTNIPSLFLVKNGEVVNKVVGVQQKKQLQSWILGE